MYNYFGDNSTHSECVFLTQKKDNKQVTGMVTPAWGLRGVDTHGHTPLHPPFTRFSMESKVTNIARCFPTDALAPDRARNLKVRVSGEQDET